MTFRQATIDDIKALHAVRMAVKENVLSNPALVTEDHYRRFLTTDGMGWLCEMEGTVTGFAIVNTLEGSVWALFVHPAYEGKGIGRTLQGLLLDWYFVHHTGGLWLTTAPGTRAEAFYRQTGWVPTGREPNGEIRFEISPTRWNEKRTP